MSGEHFLHKAVELAKLGAATAEQRTHPVRQPPGKQEGDGHSENKDGHKHRCDGQHHNKGDDHHHDAFQDLQKIGGKRLVYGVHIIGDGGDDVAGLVTVKKAYRQSGKAFKDIMAHLP